MTASSDSLHGMVSSEEARADVIAKYFPLIQALANRLAYSLPACLDADDLASAGVIGLMDALAKYDPSRGATFKTYAEFRIRGAMLDEIRSMDWVPRSVRERMALVQRVTRQFLHRHDRMPTHQELAEALNMSEDELNQFLGSSSESSLVSIEQLGTDGLPERNLLRILADTSSPDPLTTSLTERVRRVLEDAIRRLPEKERSVLMLYYCDELTMKQIGTMLNVTESRVCQIHAHAVAQLRSILTVRL